MRLVGARHAEPERRAEIEEVESQRAEHDGDDPRPEALPQSGHEDRDEREVQVGPPERTGRRPGEGEREPRGEERERIGAQDANGGGCHAGRGPGC